MIISKLNFTNINSGYLGTDIDFSLSVKFIISRFFFTDNEGQYLLILPTNIGYYSKKKRTKNTGFRPTNSGSISKFSLTNTVRNESNPRPAGYMRYTKYTGATEEALPRHIARSQGDGAAQAILFLCCSSESQRATKSISVPAVLLF
jgi:hypothetical protein